MKFSNENPHNEGVRLSAEPRRPTLKEIREKWEPYSRNPGDQTTPINWGIVYVLNDILSYLEGMESAPPRYVPEPRLGPQPESDEDAIERGRALAQVIRAAQTEEPKLCTTSGEPVDKVRAEQTETTGQHKSYIVLCAEERAKGFVRPYRDSYKHVGERPRFAVRDLTAEEQAIHSKYGYIKYEEYPESETPRVGRFWTEAQLKSGCGTVTTMGRALSETYSRDPGFYGATFCTGCQTHLPVAEFIWTADGERVGS